MKLFLMSDIFLREIISALSATSSRRGSLIKYIFFFEKTEIMSTDMSELFSFKNLSSILRDIEKHDKP